MEAGYLKVVGCVTASSHAASRAPFHGSTGKPDSRRISVPMIVWYRRSLWSVTATSTLNSRPAIAIRAGTRRVPTARPPRRRGHSQVLRRRSALAGVHPESRSGHPGPRRQGPRGRSNEANCRTQRMAGEDPRRGQGRGDRPRRPHEEGCCARIEAVGLEISGVYLLFRGDQPYVLEVNASRDSAVSSKRPAWMPRSRWSTRRREGERR